MLLRFATTILHNSVTCTLNRLPRVMFLRCVSYYNIPCRGTLKTMKLTSLHFHQLFTPELKQLVSLFEGKRYELRIAGGAVRDLLMDKIPSDVDFATVATPSEMKEMFEAEGVRMINNKGESHGTITARIHDQNFEVTTLRMDVVTDGRRAQVKFTKDWQVDANRRDLTINAMFLGFDGTVYDYFNGVRDLNDRRVRFVGGAAERIQEDYLRIMRYFRFYGRISTDPNQYESEALEAIRDNTAGLADISGERLWVELRKIVCGDHSDSIVGMMDQLGVTPYLGLPEKLNLADYREVYRRSQGLHPLPTTLVAALVKDEEDVERLNARLKMSNDQINICRFIVQRRQDRIGSHLRRYFQDMYTDGGCHDAPKLMVRLGELMKYNGDKHALEELAGFVPQKFVVTGFDLFEANVPKGPVFGQTLTKLRTMWKDSGYTLTKDDLIASIPEIIQKSL